MGRRSLRNSHILQAMKSSICILAIAAAFLGSITASEARSYGRGGGYSNQVYISGYRSCGTPIYRERYIIRYQRCGTPVWGCRVISPPRAYCPPPRPRYHVVPAPVCPPPRPYCAPHPGYYGRGGVVIQGSIRL